MKYTLIAFEMHVIDLKDVAQQPTELARLLDQTKKYRVDIFHGAYVFEMQKGWRDIHLLRSFLAKKEKTFAELPFESVLSGFFPPAVAAALSAIGRTEGEGISLRNLSN